MGMGIPCKSRAMSWNVALAMKMRGFALRDARFQAIDAPVQCGATCTRIQHCAPCVSAMDVAN